MHVDPAIRNGLIVKPTTQSIVDIGLRDGKIVAEPGSGSWIRRDHHQPLCLEA